MTLSDMVNQRAPWRSSLSPCLCVVIATSVLLLFSAVTFADTDDQAKSPYAAILAEYDIKPNSAELREYLKKLHPSEQQLLETRRLIKLLGAEAFTDRELAMKQLMSMPVPPSETLREAARREAPEVRWRAKKILSSEKPRRLALMHAVFKTIEREKIQGLTSELLQAVPLCEPLYIQKAVRAAVRASTQSKDMDLLVQATTNDNPEVVVAAIAGLGTLGESARDQLRELMEESKTDEITLAAAWALANQGDRNSLAKLIELLDADSLKVRIAAVQTLRQVTATNHKYVAYEAASNRRAAIKRWEDWLENEGDTAKLHFPLKRTRTEIGHTLLTIYTQNKVIELDAAGKQVWEKSDLGHPWSSQGLPNGHRLISCYNGKYVVEYDTEGKEIWRKDKLPNSPFNVQRLDSGNTLIACSDSSKVVEIRPDGKTTWDVTIAGRPMDAKRLENGLTLVTLQKGNRVVEIDGAGKALWELKGLKGPITAQRLENGNTLVAEVSGNRVGEWDRKGTLVWEYAGLANPYCAQRLANGNTLIAHGKDVRVVDRAGKIIWKKDMTGLAHATRF